jgi:hypothetical protein
MTALENYEIPWNLLYETFYHKANATVFVGLSPTECNKYDTRSELIQERVLFKNI